VILFKFIMNGYWGENGFTVAPFQFFVFFPSPAMQNGVLLSLLSILQLLRVASALSEGTRLLAA
jgi:hypothetical protein